MKKFFLIILGLFLSLIILEMLLQITSIIVQKNINNTISKHISLSKQITILCIGESTTYKQYPIQLQKILDKNYPNKFKVIDCGLYGQKTINILDNINNWIEQFKPNIIISMIGINDWKILPWEKEKYSIFYNILNYFKLYKIFCYFINVINLNKTYNNISKESNLYKYFKSYINILEGTTSHSENSVESYKYFDTITKEIFNKNNKYENYYVFKTLKDIDYCYMYEDFINKKIDFNDKIIYNSEIFNFANSKDIENIPKDNYTDILYGGMAIKFIQDKNLKKATEFFEKAESYRLKYYNFNTQQTYNEIVNIVYRNNIKFIAMQYPMRNIQSLKKLLSNNKYFDNITFVSNEENFKNYLYNIGNYSDLFIDQFAGDFGHCTDLGNQMIAKNIKEYIINN